MDLKAYLAHKSAIVFDFLNSQRDGVLTYDQMQRFSRNLVEVGRHEVANKVKIIYTEYFNRLCSAAGKAPESSSSLNKAEFVQAHAVVQLTDWFRKEFLETVPDLYFHSVDHDRDGYISLEEWQEMYRARGITNESFMRSSFAKLDKNNDGAIKQSEFKRAFIQFGLGEDQTDDFSFLYDVQAST